MTKSIQYELFKTTDIKQELVNNNYRGNSDKI